VGKGTFGKFFWSPEVGQGVPWYGGLWFGGKDRREGWSRGGGQLEEPRPFGGVRFRGATKKGRQKKKKLRTKKLPFHKARLGPEKGKVAGKSFREVGSQECGGCVLKKRVF